MRLLVNLIFRISNAVFNYKKSIMHTYARNSQLAWSRSKFGKFSGLTALSIQFCGVGIAGNYL